MTSGLLNALSLIFQLQAYKSVVHLSSNVDTYFSNSVYIWFC